jgi:L-threonylcarbamoyladenylate synthase
MMAQAYNRGIGGGTALLTAEGSSVRRGGMVTFTSSTEAVRLAIAALARGAVIGLPTETVYGLACDAQDPAALARLFEFKGRPPKVALPVALAEPAWALAWQKRPDPRIAALAEHWWPGPLTIVVDAHEDVSPVITAGLGTVALRVPDEPQALAVIRGFGRAVALTSANRHGAPPAQSAQEVSDVFGGQVEVVVDGGPSALGVPTTIVALADQGAWRVLRQGGLSDLQLRRVLDGA